MGIYIRGMKMPTSCIACLLNFGEKRPEYGLTICCPYSDGVVSWRDKAFDNGRLASCGIVSVPPHGRLGDLDNFALLVLNWISTQEKAYPHEDSNALAWRLGAKAMANQIYRDVEAYPTIIPAEEGET